MVFPPLFYIKAFFNKAKKVALVLFVFYAIIHLFVYFIYKDSHKTQTETYQNTRSEFYQYINDPELNKTDEGKAYVGLIQLLACRTVGEGCSDNPKDTASDIQNSLIGKMNSFIVLPYANPPASGVQSVIATLQNVGIVPHTYAAEGIGYAALTPFKPLWLIFRNLVLLLMVILIVAIGFMIMFRAKINPQTVISIENALPKIALALILITFSYAIAGFLIDLMYATMGLIVGLFDLSDISSGVQPKYILEQAYYSSNFGLLGVMFDNNVSDLAKAFYDVIPGVMQVFLNDLVGTFALKFALVGLANAPLTGKALAGYKKGGYKFFQGIAAVFKKIKLLGNTGNAAQNGATMVIGLIGAIGTLILGEVVISFLGQLAIVLIIYFILMLSLLFAYFRLFFMFISEYVQILLLLMFAPVIIAFDAIPGRSTFADWLKSLVLHLATFPLFLILILTSKAILQVADPGTLWKPPYTYGIPANAFQVIVGMALIFMAPNFIKMFKEMTGIKPMTTALDLGSFFSGATVAVGGAIGLATQFHSIKSTLVGMNVGEGLFGTGGHWGKQEPPVRTARRVKVPGSATASAGSVAPDDSEHAGSSSH